MKKTIVFFVLLVFCFSNICYAQSNLNENELYARSAVLMDGDNGRILFSKNGDTVMPMASTTKVMTCIIALEYGNLEDIYTVSSYAASMPKVKLGVSAGEQYRLKDLLYSLMLESHNDVAVVIAEGVAGSVEAFAQLMNEKARELGCNNTHFVTPNGLDANGHCTTAEELGEIMRYAIQNETFLEITQTRSYSFSKFTVTNKNAFLDSYTGCISGKTGYTSGAGYCYVGVVEQDGKTLIAVVLASGWPPNKTYKWQDMRYLMNYGFKNYTYKTIFQGIPLLDTIQVEDGKIGHIDIFVEGELTVLLNENETYHIEYEYPNYLKAPMEKGEEIGKTHVYVENELIQSFPIYTLESDEKIDFRYCFDIILQLFLVKI